LGNRNGEGKTKLTHCWAGIKLAKEYPEFLLMVNGGGQTTLDSQIRISNFPPWVFCNIFWVTSSRDYDKNLFINNPINRYSIGQYTEGLKNNTDGSLDIYIQNASAGADKESNWLPAAEGSFNMVLRLYLPQPQALNGTWQLPLVQKVG
jgi:hypothetical protein